MGIQLFAAVYDVDACLKGIRDCLEKGWTGQGYKTIEFEEAWKEYTGLPNAHFLTTGTAALNLAVETLKEECGWAVGDEIISTPLTFVATNNCILYAKMKVVFADIDDTLCLNPKDVERKVTDKTRAVIFVGLGGNSGHYLDIVEICKKHGLKLILDAAHMAGTRLCGGHIGREADAVIYSYHVTKNLSTAEGGMLCFREKAFDKIVRNKSFNGIDKSHAPMASEKTTNGIMTYGIWLMHITVIQ
jgi:Predicted pyridoxal phosphate-dependent enzyme apparently involved in regulation of cell wall biogenesis